MKVKELLQILKYIDPELDIFMFAKGERFPVLAAQEWESDNSDTVFEIGGGWVSIEDDE